MRRPLIHPVFAAYTGGLYLLGAVLGYAGALTLPLVAWGLWWTLGASALGIVVNDYFDRELDARNPRKRQFERVYVPADARRYFFAFAAASLSALLLLALFFSAAAAWSLGLFALGTWAYNAPPLRLKERPGPDVIIGPASFAIPLLTGYALAAGQEPALALTIAAVLFFSALELFHKTFDLEADRAMGIATAATALGLRTSLGVCAALELAAAALLAAWARQPYLMLLSAPYLAMLTAAGGRPDPAARRTLYGRIRPWYVALGVLITTLAFLKLL